MTFAELLFWILVAIVAYFLLGVGLAILIVAIVLIVIYYLFNLFTNSVNKPVNKPIDKPLEQFNTTDNYIYHHNNNNNNNNNNNTIDNYIYNQNRPVSFTPTPWYVPVGQYYHNGENMRIQSSGGYHVPASISEYCVNKQLGQNTDFETAMTQCQLPPKSSTKYAPY